MNDAKDIVLNFFEYPIGVVFHWCRLLESCYLIEVGVASNESRNTSLAGVNELIISEGMTRIISIFITLPKIKRP
jgi:hypothetical protein